MQFGADKIFYRVGTWSDSDTRTTKDGQVSSEHAKKILDRNSNIRPRHKFAAVRVTQFGADKIFFRVGAKTDLDPRTTTDGQGSSEHSAKILGRNSNNIQHYGSRKCEFQLKTSIIQGGPKYFLKFFYIFLVLAGTVLSTNKTNFYLIRNVTCPSSL